MAMKVSQILFLVTTLAILAIKVVSNFKGYAWKNQEPGASALYPPAQSDYINPASFSRFSISRLFGLFGSSNPFVNQIFNPSRFEYSALMPSTPSLTIGNGI